MIFYNKYIDLNAIEFSLIIIMMMADKLARTTRLALSSASCKNNERLLERGGRFAMRSEWLTSLLLWNIKLLLLS